MQCRLPASSSKSYGFKTQSHHPICPLSTSKKKKTALPYPHLCKKKPKKNHHQPFNSHVRESTPANRSLPPNYSYGCSIFTNKKSNIISCKFSFHEIHILSAVVNLLRERRGSISPRHTPLSALSALSSRCTSSSKQNNIHFGSEKDERNTCKTYFCSSCLSYSLLLGSFSNATVV